MPIKPTNGTALAVCGKVRAAEASVVASASAFALIACDGAGAGAAATALFVSGADHEEAASGNELGYASLVPVLGMRVRFAAPMRSASAAGYAN